MPGAMHLDIGYEIAKLHDEKYDGHVLSISVEIPKAVPVEMAQKLTLDVSATFQEKSVFFRVFKNSQAVCRGWIKHKQRNVPFANKDVESLKTSITSSTFLKLDQARIYQQLKEDGFQYGDSLQILNTCITNGNESLTEMKLGETLLRESSCRTLHACVLDGMIQTTTSTKCLELDTEITRIVKKEKGIFLLPVAVEDVVVFSKPKKNMFVYTKVVNTVYSETMFSLHYNVLLLDVYGNAIIEIRNLTMFSRVTPEHKASCMLRYEQQWLPVEYRKADVSTPKTLVVSRASLGDVSNKLDGTEEQVHFVSKCSEETLSAYVNRVFVYASVMDIDVLMVVMGKHALSESDHLLGNITFNAVKENCLFVAELLRTKFKKGNKCPTFVVTQNTQQYDECDMSTKTVIGAELWGFIRSLNTEFIYGSITLVDVQPSLDESFTTLHRYVSSTYKDIMSLEPEVVVTPNGLYTAELTKGKMSMKVPRFRTTKGSKLPIEDEFSLFSVRANGMTDCFLIPTDKSFPSKEMKPIEILSANRCQKYEEIDVEHVCIHPLSVAYRTAGGANLNVDIWEDTHDRGYNVLGLEYTGRTTKNEKVVALFPTPISARRRVPRACVVSLDDVPFYKNGMLYTAMLCWEIARKTSGQKEIAIDCTRTCSQAYKILHNMIKTKTPTARVHGVREDIERVTDRQYDVYVTLGRLDTSSYFIKRSKLVVCLQENISKSASDLIVKSLCKQLVVVKPEEVMNPFHVSQHLSEVIARLKENSEFLESESFERSEMKEEEEDVVFTGFPSEVVQMRDEKQNILLPIHKPFMGLFGKEFTYIVTGGLTGLGFEIVKFLAENGAGKIVTMNRREVSGKDKDTIEKLEIAYGCSIFCVQSDVTNIQSIKAAKQIIDKKFDIKSLKGVFHCAGVLVAKTLSTLQETDINDVMKPKVLWLLSRDLLYPDFGTINMHIMTKDCSLDFFVVSSSVSSFIGLPGQNIYAAANCFQDAFMKWRRGIGLVGQSINWGPLSVGMAAQSEIQEYLEQKGYGHMSVPEIRGCLHEAILCDLTGVVYLSSNWEKVAADFDNPMMARARLVLQNILTEEVAATKQQFQSQHVNFDVHSLKSKDLATQEQALEEYVKVVFEKVTHTPEKLNLQTSIGVLGLDSMSTVTIINTIQEHTGHTIDWALLLDTSVTLKDIVGELLKKIFQ